MQVLDLACAGREWGGAYHREDVCIAPEPAHHPAAALLEPAEKRLLDATLVERSEARMNKEAELRTTALSLSLDELEVGRRPPSLCGSTVSSSRMMSRSSSVAPSLVSFSKLRIESM